MQKVMTSCTVLSMDFTQLSYRNFKKMLKGNQFSSEELIFLAMVTPEIKIFGHILGLKDEGVNQRIALNVVNDINSYQRFWVYADFLMHYIPSEEEAINFIPLAFKTSNIYGFMDFLIENYPKHMLHYLEACKNLNFRAQATCRLLQKMLCKDGFSDEVYETIYQVYIKVEKMQYYPAIGTGALTKLKHLPSSVFYAFCLDFPDILAEDYIVQDFINYPNLTPEIIELLPEDKQRYVKLASDKEGLFAGINKTLTRVAKNAPMEERLQTEAFKSTEHYQAYVERQNDFEVFETNLKASQDLAETLINSLNSDLPIDLTAGLRAVRNKTHKLYEFYETLLTSPFNTQGNRAVTYAKVSAEESLEDYEEIIDKLLTLTEKERNSKPRREKFDALKADTETLIQLDKHIL